MNNKIQANLSYIEDTLNSLYRPEYDLENFQRTLSSIDTFSSIVQKQQEIEDLKNEESKQ